MFETFANFFVFEILKLEPSQFSASLEFFVADALKIAILMLVVIFAISFVRTFLPTDKLEKLFRKSKFGIAYFLAAILGAVTPFCSCSSIPLFLGFLEANAPVGVAFAFLATSPLVNEVVFAVMVGKFGWRIAGIYAASGIILGVVAGILIEKIWGRRPIELVKKGENVFGTQSNLPTEFAGRMKYSANRALAIFGKMWWILLIGVAIGAAIHGFIPAEFFLKILGESSKIWGVPLAVILGIPIYARSASIVPIIFALTVKGLPLGTALALMMSAAGLSLPEAIMLKRIIPLKLLVLFFGIVATGIILIGFGFNFVG
ncbi:permease [Candidatus Gracilibacteria bacterium]|nr:permease [Candidatus Gracilibacteria bacterium]MCF7856034.1 permease [Candidatus Gracilibacteria bacterium]MCF7896411.1 permease [Candidatus Gracilibacteria bacterium]